ncbi:MAG: HD domain-containing protein [Planctomycetota bacterium]|jgi:HD superfamily phosphodiesterase
MREELIAAMTGIFGRDSRRINHALKVLKYAEEIQGHEGGDSLVVTAAAILHDIGIHEAERKYNSSAGHLQEVEGPPIAEKIMNNLKIDQDVMDHVCKIIANHHSAKDIDTLEFKIIWDADWLVNIREEFPEGDIEQLGQLVKNTFKTTTGMRLAEFSLVN